MASTISNPSSIVAALNGLCEWLTQEVRPAREAAIRLGAIESESGSALYVKPMDPAFAHAIVSHSDDSEQKTSYVELRLARPGAVTVAELVERFGAYRVPVRVHFNSPPAIAFTVDRGAERPLTCLVVAEAAGSEADVVHGHIREVGARVDPRL